MALAIPNNKADSSAEVAEYQFSNDFLDGLEDGEHGEEERLYDEEECSGVEDIELKSDTEEAISEDEAHDNDKVCSTAHFESSIADGIQAEKNTSSNTNTLEIKEANTEGVSMDNEEWPSPKLMILDTEKNLPTNKTSLDTGSSDSAVTSGISLQPQDSLHEGITIETLRSQSLASSPIEHKEDIEMTAISQSDEISLDLNQDINEDADFSALLDNYDIPLVSGSVDNKLQEDSYAENDMLMGNPHSPDESDADAMAAKIFALQKLQSVQKAAMSTKEKMKQNKRTKDELNSFQTKKKNKKKRGSREGSSEVDDSNDSTPLWEEDFEEGDPEGQEAQDEYYDEAIRIKKLRQRGVLTKEAELKFEIATMKEKRRRLKVVRDRQAAAAQKALDEKIDGHVQASDNESEEDLFVPPTDIIGPQRHQKRRSGSAGWHDLVGTDSEPLDEEDTDANTIAEETRQAMSKRKGQKSAQLNTGKRKRSSKETRGRVSRKRQKGPVMTNIGSLITSNPMASAHHLEDGEEDEGRLKMGSKDKQKALRQLLASIPQEHQDLARADKAALAKASKNFDGYGTCRVAEGGSGWVVKNMKLPLRHFQMLGSGWMRVRENDPRAPHGGLIADEMGMGKTIMMLANIVNGIPPPNSKREVKATLIIVPSSLMNQWFEEIKKHCDLNKLGRAIIWKSGKSSMLQTNNDRKFLAESFIVLCTYHEATKSCIKVVFPKYCQTEDEKEAWLEKNLHKFRGLIHQLNWWRVVVDEAHVSYHSCPSTLLSIREPSIFNN
jgi:SNF2 family DNA or RNA helicase